MNYSQNMKENFERMRDSFTVKVVFGEPYEAHGRTIIPVARVAYGFGAGYGSGNKSEVENASETRDGEGGGGGGGGAVIPVGVVEIGPDKTRFIPIHDWKKIVKATVGGVAFGLMLARKLKKAERKREESA